MRLHGPSLLNPPKPVPTKDNPTPAGIGVQEHVLKTMIINLYQTAAEEVCEAFRTNLRDLAQLPPPGFYLNDRIKFRVSRPPSLPHNCVSLWMERRFAAILRVLWRRMV